MSGVTLASSSAEALPAAPPESLLIGHIQAHVRQGDKARQRADQAREKSHQHYIAAGQYLATLKAHYSRSWDEWETLLKAKVKLSVSRASELMAIGSGKKSTQEIRDGTAQRVRALRARGSSLHSQCNEEDHEAPPSSGQSQCPEENGTAKIQAAFYDYLEEVKREEAQARAVAHQMVAENYDFIKQLFRAIDQFTADDFLHVLRCQQQEASAPRQATKADDIDNTKAAHHLIDLLVASTPGTRSTTAQLVIDGSRQGQFDPLRHALSDLYEKLARAGR